MKMRMKITTTTTKKMAKRKKNIVGKMSVKVTVMVKPEISKKKSLPIKNRSSSLRRKQKQAQMTSTTRDTSSC